MALTEKQLEELRRVIDRRHAELEAEIREDLRRVHEDSVSDLAGAAPDAGDSSVADLIAGLEYSELSRDMNEFRDLEAARERIAQGTYGTCLDCGADIGIERLRVQAAARRCIQCQAAHERSFAGPGAPSL